MKWIILALISILIVSCGSSGGEGSGAGQQSQNQTGNNPATCEGINFTATRMADVIKAGFQSIDCGLSEEQLMLKIN